MRGFGLFFSFGERSSRKGKKDWLGGRVLKGLVVWRGL